jgi:hypothetical protein
VSHGFSGVTFITDPYESKDSLWWIFPPEFVTVHSKYE